jgi:hypothetical protein
METSQNRRLYFEVYSSSPLTTYTGERSTPFSKAYGIKVRWYGERGKHCEIGEHIRNPWGT